MKVKSIPTWKLKEILDNHATRGSTGKDYEPYREELQYELWDRQNKENVKEYESCPDPKY